MTANDFVTMLNDQITFDRTRLEASTKQNERALIKGRIEALSDMLMNVRIEIKVQERIAAALAAQAAQTNS